MTDIMANGLTRDEYRARVAAEKQRWEAAETEVYYALRGLGFYMPEISVTVTVENLSNLEGLTLQQIADSEFTDEQLERNVAWL